mmetsp:Transcript_10876/g.31527  ORF Transcript_10876/g.31527 Transcript_10876/m.31527 type:complete len:207 (+) Transcript_10876:2058-2678(+)
MVVRPQVALVQPGVADLLIQHRKYRLNLLPCGLVRLAVYAGYRLAPRQSADDETPSPWPLDGLFDFLLGGDEAHLLVQLVIVVLTGGNGHATHLTQTNLGLLQLHGRPDLHLLELLLLLLLSATTCLVSLRLRCAALDALGLPSGQVGARRAVTRPLDEVPLHINVCTCESMLLSFDKRRQPIVSMIDIDNRCGDDTSKSTPASGK